VAGVPLADLLIFLQNEFGLWNSPFTSTFSQIGDFAILLKSGFRRWDAAVGQVCFD